MNPTSPKPDPGLNPTLKSTQDDTYDTTHRTAPPVETTSVQRQEGRGWPMVWLVVVLICVALAIYIMVG